MDQNEEVGLEEVGGDEKQLGPQHILHLLFTASEICSLASHWENS
jgi:hypothetical protein